MGIVQSNKIGRLTNIQALRGFAALMVVLSHLRTIELKHSGDAILPKITQLGIFGVDLFFTISGFIMVYVTWSDERSLRNSTKFLFARATRIYPIYWLIAIFVFIAWSKYPVLVNVDPQQTNFIKSFFLWPDNTLPMLKVAWTLIHEMYFYLIFAFILIFKKKWLMPLLSTWVVIVLVGNLAGLAKINPETALIFNPLGIEFFLGALAAWIFLKFDNVNGSLIFKLSLVVWLGSIMFIILYMPDEYAGYWQRVFLYGLPSAFTIYGLASMDRSGMHLPTWSVRLGDISYSLYLSHVLTLSALGYIWSKITRTGLLDNALAVPVLLTATIIAAGLIWRFAEMPMLKIAKHAKSTLFK